MAAINWLTRPHPRIVDAESQQNARLLASILLATALVVGFVIVLVVIYDPHDLFDSRTLVGLSGIFVALLAYVFNRAGHVHWATLGFIAYFTLVLIVAPYVGSFPEFTPFLVAPMLLVGMFYSFKWTAVLVASSVAAIFALNSLFVDADIWDRRILWYFLLFAGGLVLVFKYHLSALEKVRQKRLSEVNARHEQQQLQLAVEKERSEAFRTLMASIAHDIKTPLAIISTSLYLAEKHTDPGVRLEKLDNIRKQVHRLASFIQDLMEIARLDSEQPDLRLNMLDVNAVVMDIEAEYRDIILQKRLVFALELDDAIPTIQADQADLRRALTNLVGNAVDYTPEGRSIVVRTQCLDAGVVVEVADTGIGISDDALPHIFDRFYRAPEARRIASSGSGLGLAIVKRVVEMHGGAVQVESALGKGTTFRVHLPVRDGPP